MIFNLFDPKVNTTIAFLKLLKVRVNDTTVNETLQNHPDWPSLLSLSDSLNKWNVPNGAGRIEKNDIDQLPLPFLVYTNDRESEWVIVTKFDDLGVSYIADAKNIAKNKEDFFKIWEGVYLIAEPGQASCEKDYEANKRKALLNNFVPIILVALLLGLSFFKFYHTNLSIGIFLQYLILLVGVFVTSLLLWYEMDKNNPILQKVCTGIAKGNCNAILTSKQSKLFTWLSWSEVGFFYFTGSLLTLLFVSNSISILAWLSILALPYTVFSIYFQWRVVKQWCILCLCVQVLLVLGGANVLTNQFLASPDLFSISPLIKSALLFVLPVLAWYTLRPYILGLQEATNTKREYLRIKFNVEIFETLLKKQKMIRESTDGLGINIGNPNATNTIVKVCNPYCGPCAKAHAKLEKLLEEIPNLKVKIIFTTPNEPGHYSYKPTKHLMAITRDNNEVKIKSALDDWYLADKKDYELFVAKYPMNGELEMQAEKIDAMYKWCIATNIEYTPTIFINGHQLPNAYNIEDLGYFLLG